MKNIKSIWIMSLVMPWLYAAPVYGVSEQPSLETLRYAELQVAAVSTDMHLYFGWAFDEKKAMKVSSEKAILDLKELEQQIYKHEYPDDLAELETRMLNVIESLQQIYSGVEGKDLEMLEKEYRPFHDLYAEYGRAFKAAWLTAYPNLASTKELDQLAEELKWIENEVVRDAYKKALDLIETKKYAEAYGLLVALEINQHGPIEHMIKLRLSDSLRRMNPEEADKIESDALDASDYGLKLLTEIVDSNDYSHVLYEAFYKWRTTMQEMYHGMSNFSSIPNKEYNQQRLQVIQTVKKYLVENPHDQWAMNQLDLLWDLPNIQRGGPMGNDNLIHWGLLYGDLKASDHGASNG